MVKRVLQNTNINRLTPCKTRCSSGVYTPNKQSKDCTDANERAHSLRKSIKAELIGDNRGYEVKKRKRGFLERLTFKKEEIKTGKQQKSPEKKPKASPSKRLKYQFWKIRVPRYSGKPQIMRDILPDREGGT